MGKGKAILVGTAATVVVAGGLVYATLDRWFSDEPAPPADSEQVGPGSGDELGPGETPTGDNLDRGNGPGEFGPGSGDELKPGETPTGDNLDRGNGPGEFGPGSGEELPADEPTGPGSGDELKPGETPTGDNLDRGNGPGEFGPGSGEELPADEPTGPGSGDEISFESVTKGSCNTIDDASTCLDYIGSYFGTLENMKLHCAGSGTFSSKPCPRPAVGGCHIGANTANELITWHYDYGGDPFNSEVVPYAAMACNASPYATWIAN